MIYTYIQQTVLATKSSYIKLPSQVSLIDYLISKQEKKMSMGHTEKNTQSLLKHTLPTPYPEASTI